MLPITTALLCMPDARISHGFIWNTLSLLPVSLNKVYPSVPTICAGGETSLDGLFAHFWLSRLAATI